MLHAGVQRHHGQVVGVHDVVDVTGQAQGELGHGHQQGVAAAGRSALDVHGGAAGGLAQRAADVLADLREALDQAQGDGGFALAQGGGGDGGDLDELAVGLVLQAVHDLDEVKLRGLAVGNDLLGQQAELLPEIIHRGQLLFGIFSDLPVFVDGRIKHVGFLEDRGIKHGQVSSFIDCIHNRVVACFAPYVVCQGAERSPVTAQ